MKKSVIVLTPHSKWKKTEMIKSSASTYLPTEKQFKSFF